MHNFSEHWQQQLIARQENDLFRARLTAQSAQASEVFFSGKKVINFSSNDYLGLANHPKLIEAMQVASKKYGVGSGASHLVCGHSEEHHALEEELAKFTGRDKAVLFSTGYMANIGVQAALLDKQSAVFQDKLNHASLIDGAMLSDADFKRYQHNDMDHLQSRLASSDAMRKMVAVDGVFSMDGDLAALPEICEIAKQHQACVMVDDAHGFGCLGSSGAGTAEHFNLTQNDVHIYMGTLGKALGSFGAFVAGDAVMIENIIQFSRSYIYTTALPPAISASTRAALKLLQEEAWRREKLQSNITYFKQAAVSLGLPVMNSGVSSSGTAIQPLLVKDSQQALNLSRALMDKGILAAAIRPPTVPVNGARLRITLNAEHSIEQINYLLDALVSSIPKNLLLDV